MRTIPAQFVLVFVVIVTVSIVNLVPGQFANTRISNTASSDADYSAPIVPTGNQKVYLSLLRADLNNLGPESRMTKTSDSENLSGCRQSYNAIAGQIAASTLNANNLPQYVN